VSHRAWNDLTPAVEPVVAHGRQTVAVIPVTATLGGMRSHVMLRIGEETDSQLMQLTPTEARQIAISLLQAAEKVEVASRQPVHSN